MIVYKVVHTRVGEHGELVEFYSEFDSFRQASYWTMELARQKLPTRWEFEFVNSPKQYEFPF